MPEEARFDTEIIVGYRAVNRKTGEVGVYVPVHTINVYDQSSEAASAHLVSINSAIQSPAVERAAKKLAK